MKTICLGDSLTYGYGVSPDDTWVTRAEEALSGGRNDP